MKKIILQCNFDTRKLPIYLPVFYKECFDAWATLNVVPVLSHEDVVNQIIWNNKNVPIGKASIFDKKVMRKGIVTIGDLLSDTGDIVRIFTQHKPSVHCTAINGVLHIELN